MASTSQVAVDRLSSANCKGQVIVAPRDEQMPVEFRWRGMHRTQTRSTPSLRLLAVSSLVCLFGITGCSTGSAASNSADTDGVARSAEGPHAGKRGKRGKRGKHGKHGKHGDFSALDTDGNGSVSMAEAKDSRMARHFIDIDADNDGQVTAAEHKAFRELMKDPAARAKLMMKSKDANGDGVLTADEMGEDKKADHFARWDTNSDGTVTLEELRVAEEAKRGRHEKGKRGRHKKGKHGDGEHGKRGHHDFSSLDADASGGVSLEEAGDSRLAKHFSDVDTNGDGQVTQVEQSAFHEMMKDPATRAKFMMGKKDANKDGVLTADEFGDGKKAEHFDRLDANGDGQVTLEELSADKHGRHGERGPHGKRGGHGKRGPDGGHGDSPELQG